MTQEQQKTIDRFHEKVIALIFKRRRAQKYGDWAGECAITDEILKIEDERKAYERNVVASRQEKRKIARAVRETEAGSEPTEAETEIRSENENVVS